jgi:hypothetical protein
MVVRLARVWGLRRNLLPWERQPTLSGRSPTLLEVGFLIYYVLAALAVYGWILLRRRAVPVWIITSTFVLVTVTCVLVYGDVRFREPAELSLVVLAAVAVDQLWARRRRARQSSSRVIRASAS